MLPPPLGSRWAFRSNRIVSAHCNCAAEAALAGSDRENSCLAWLFGRGMAEAAPSVREQRDAFCVFPLVISLAMMPDKEWICKSGVKREPSIFRYVDLKRKVKTDNVFGNIGYNCINDIADTPVSEALGIEPVGAAPTLRTIQRHKAGVFTTARFFVCKISSRFIRRTCDSQRRARFQSTSPYSAHRSFGAASLSACANFPASVPIPTSKLCPAKLPVRKPVLCGE